MLAAYFLVPNSYFKYEAVYWAVMSITMLGAVTLVEAGLVNFGYGMYVAAGAYTAALLFKHLKIGEVAVAIPLSAAVGAAFGAVTGLALAKLRGIFYALSSLALSMVLYGFLVKFYYFTGGSDGVTLYGATIGGQPLGMDALALLTAAALATALWFRHKYLQWGIWHLARGIRENEVKLWSLGVDTGRTVVALSAFAGLWGGLGGSLLAYLTAHVSPELSFWAFSGFVVAGALVSAQASYGLGFLVGGLIARALNVSAFYTNAYELSIGLGLLAAFAAAKLWKRHA